MTKEFGTSVRGPWQEPSLAVDVRPRAHVAACMGRRRCPDRTGVVVGRPKEIVVAKVIEVFR